MKEGTKILRCSCESKFQDRNHGPGMRVMNSTRKGNSPSATTYRCTVCGAEQTVSD